MRMENENEKFPPVLHLLFYYIYVMSKLVFR